MSVYPMSGLLKGPRGRRPARSRRAWKVITEPGRTNSRSMESGTWKSVCCVRRFPVSPRPKRTTTTKKPKKTTTTIAPAEEGGNE